MNDSRRRPLLHAPIHIGFAAAAAPICAIRIGFAAAAAPTCAHSHRIRGGRRSYLRPFTSGRFA